MPEKRLNELLTELHANLEGPGEVTPRDRALLKSLARDIRQQLDTTDDGEVPLADRLADAVDQFEHSHPRIAYTLRGVMDALAKMGI